MTIKSEHTRMYTLTVPVDEFTASRMAPLLQYAQAHGLTVEDVLQEGMGEVLTQMLGKVSGESLEVSGTARKAKVCGGVK